MHTFSTHITHVRRPADHEYCSDYYQHHVFFFLLREFINAFVVTNSLVSLQFSGLRYSLPTTKIHPKRPGTTPIIGPPCPNYVTGLQPSIRRCDAPAGRVTDRLVGCRSGGVVHPRACPATREGGAILSARHRRR
jgi:hypothetical protein